VEGHNIRAALVFVFVVLVFIVLLFVLARRWQPKGEGEQEGEAFVALGVGVGVSVIVVAVKVEGGSDGGGRRRRVAGDWEEKDGSGRQQDSSQGWGRWQITKQPKRGRRARPAHTVELVPMCEAWAKLHWQKLLRQRAV
jgi:hypothetical protein